MTRPSWMRPTDDEVAGQLTTFATNLSPALATSLGVDATEVDTLTLGAAFFSYLQLQLVPAVRAFSTGVTQTRDLFELDKTPETLSVPVANFPAPPAAISGKTFDSDFFDWADSLVKRIKLSPNYTDQIGATLDIVYRAPDVVKVLKINGHDELPGGVVKVRVSRAFPMTIIEAAVDGGAFEQKAMLPMSEITIQVPAGAPHQVQLRARGAGRDGTPVGNYSDVLSITSQA